MIPKKIGMTTLSLRLQLHSNEYIQTLKEVGVRFDPATYINTNLSKDADCTSGGNTSEIPHGPDAGVSMIVPFHLEMCSYVNKFEMARPRLTYVLHYSFAYARSVFFNRHSFAQSEHMIQLISQHTC